MPTGPRHSFPAIFIVANRLSSSGWNLRAGFIIDSKNVIKSKFEQFCGELPVVTIVFARSTIYVPSFQRLSGLLAVCGLV